MSTKHTKFRTLLGDHSTKNTETFENPTDTDKTHEASLRRRRRRLRAAPPPPPLEHAAVFRPLGATRSQNGAWPQV